MSSEAQSYLERVGKEAREAIEGGAAPTPEKLAVRRLLELFGYAKRGRVVVSRIRNALEAHGLRTSPDLTLGGYCRLLQNPANWDKLRLEFSRELFVERLEAVREIRNEVMHFRPDGLDPEKQQVLHGLVAFFRHLARMGVVDTSANSN